MAARLRPISSNQEYYTKTHNYYISRSNKREVFQKWTEGPFCHRVVNKLVENLAHYGPDEPVHVLGVGSGNGKLVLYTYKDHSEYNELDMFYQFHID